MSWARVQPCVALNSAESEYYALCSGAQEGILAQQLALELGFSFGLILKTDSLSAKQATEKIGALRQKHMQLRWHFLKDLVHNGLITIEKVPTLMNISDMLTKPVSRQILRRCLAQAESWRMDEEQICEEQTFDEQLVELNVVERGVVLRDQCLTQARDKWTTPWLVMLILATGALAVYTYHVMLNCMKRVQKIVRATMRTMGTQSQTTYTALARHATPRFTVLPDQLHGSFDEGGRRSWGSQARTLTPRTTRTLT